MVYEKDTSLCFKFAIIRPLKRELGGDVSQALVDTAACQLGILLFYGYPQLLLHRHLSTKMTPLLVIVRRNKLPMGMRLTVHLAKHATDFDQHTFSGQPLCHLKFCAMS